MKFNPTEAINNLEYNTNRRDLVLPEYGRHLQKLIDQVILIEDREERNRAARAVIDIMGTINPHLRDVLDFQHKLWDQLFKMSRFELDVDSPYEKPKAVTDFHEPVLIDYPKNNHEYRFYGSNIVDMIQEAVNWEEGERKDALIMVIANHMKKSYVNWNNESVEDAVIFQHLKKLSAGKIDLTTGVDENNNSVNLAKTNNWNNPYQNNRNASGGNSNNRNNQFQNRNNSGNNSQRNNSNNNSNNKQGNNTNNRFVKKNNTNSPKNRNTN
ncbi:DUF4290 domain-containing protein [Flavobacterium sp. CBA20B-1]|uniref:DUF4290 domain-containing protein n=1 Tax=unclassified Flavobacterium TaxID=196869 RepID=UPI0022253DCE|nr:MULTISPECIES: DUF4290 domain-containing protein [unclassified Flavobacterium]WCM41873.1 DUF4290 domain-containing protein [Flavobacterium sp. CBA20B-1]